MLSNDQIKEILVPRLKELEEERKTINVYRTPRNIVLALFLLALASLIGSDSLEIAKETQTAIKIASGIATVVFMIVLGVLSIHLDTRRKKFEAKVKEYCYQPVFDAWRTGTVYKPKQNISEAVVKASGMVSSYNEHKGDDYGEGKLEDGRTFFFSELELNQRTGNKGKNRFKGLFLVLDGVELFKDHPSKIRVGSKRDSRQPPKKAHQKGSLSSNPFSADILDADFVVPTQQITPSLPKEVIKANFEKLYNVSTSTSDAASLEFPIHFMEQGNALTDIIWRPIRISFQQGRVYAMFWSTPNFWDIGISRPLYSENQLDKQIADFQLNFEFMDRIIAATAHKKPVA